MQRGSALEFDDFTGFAIARTGEHTVTFSTTRPVAAAVTMSPLVTAVDQARLPIGPGPLRRGAHIIGDVLAAVGVVLCIPLVILAIGAPIALCLRFLLWIAGMF